MQKLSDRFSNNSIMIGVFVCACAWRRGAAFLRDYVARGARRLITNGTGKTNKIPNFFPSLHISDFAGQ